MDDNEVMNDEELQHHGIKGMKWGHRRFQNKDGSLTPAGRERYADDYEDYEAYHKERKRQERKERTKTLLKVGAAAAAGAIAVIGIKKYIESKGSKSTEEGKKVIEEALKDATKKTAPETNKPEKWVRLRDLLRNTKIKDVSSDGMQTLPGVKPLWERKNKPNYSPLNPNAMRSLPGVKPLWERNKTPRYSPISKSTNAARVKVAESSAPKTSGFNGMSTVPGATPLWKRKKF